ncbi:hypothetical protein E2C01_045675 [Portunus trituberculatus]|uniref:Uncharacterized protein n=1 Tax=Portunus trituberculatus TaxID=210409 RepID=A0A5B7FWE8_PORTR|nr:hypothetical protein [Portunus trituberculatus]
MEGQEAIHGEKCETSGEREVRGMRGAFDMHRIFFLPELCSATTIKVATIFAVVISPEGQEGGGVHEQHRCNGYRAQVTAGMQPFTFLTDTARSPSFPPPTPSTFGSAHTESEKAVRAIAKEIG